jgi:hypothetical protein
MAEDYSPDKINALNAQKRAQNLLSSGYATVLDPVDETFVPITIIPKKAKNIPAKKIPYEAETMPYDMKEPYIDSRIYQYEDEIFTNNTPSINPRRKFELISSAYGADKFEGSEAIPGEFNLQTIIQKGKQAFTQGIDRLKNKVENREHFIDYKDFNKRIDYADREFKNFEPTIDNNKSFISDIWGPYYQTDNDPVKNKAALNRLNGNWTVPESEQEAQSVAGTIFEGDSGYSKQDIIGMLGKIGQVESQYRDKIQIDKSNKMKKEDKAYSYYQVEPRTALSLLTDSKAIFGKKFEDAFSMYAIPGKTAREVLSELTLSELADQMLFNPNLGATLAAGKIIATTKKK